MRNLRNIWEILSAQGRDYPLRSAQPGNQTNIPMVGSHSEAYDAYPIYMGGQSSCQSGDPVLLVGNVGREKVPSYRKAAFRQE